jgi:hypothetical protein
MAGGRRFCVCGGGYAIEFGVVEGEDGVDVLPPIKTRRNPRTALPLRTRNQAMHNPQSFRIRQFLALNRGLGLLVRRSKSHPMKPVIDPTISSLK